MSRKKITIQARELSEMDINLISLVKRGANRVPFRIVKNSGESTMSLNLSDLFLMKKDKAPQVVALVLNKSADVDKYTQAFLDAGFEVDHKVEEEEIDTLMFTKSDDMSDAVVIKMNEDAAIVVSDFKKGLEMWPDSNSFAENVTKAGFAPSFRMANDILSDTIGNIIFSEGDASVTKSQVSEAIEQFKSYIEAVMDTIPVEAFKAEAVVIEVEKGLIPQAAPKPEEKKAKKKAPAKKAEGEEEAEEQDEAAATSEEVVKDDSTEEGETSEEEQTTEVAAEKEDEGEAAEEVQAEETVDPVAELTKSLAGITASIKELKDSVTESVGAVKEELTTRLDEVEAQVKKTDEALAGTVHSEEAEDNSADHHKKSQGSDEVSWDSVLDFGDVEIS